MNRNEEKAVYSALCDLIERRKRQLRLFQEMTRFLEEDGGADLSSHLISVIRSEVAIRVIRERGIISAYDLRREMEEKGFEIDPEGFRSQMNQIVERNPRVEVSGPRGDRKFWWVRKKKKGVKKKKKTGKKKGLPMKRKAGKKKGVKKSSGTLG